MAEWARDVEASLKALEPVWKSPDEAPRIEEFSKELQAEILRLAGYCLSIMGRTRNLDNYQERGRDMLSEVVGRFSDLALPDKANEAKVMLALTYYYEGRLEEAEIILKEAESNYESNQLHPVYLKICLNKISALALKHEYTEALRVLDAIKIPMEFASDPQLLSTYHNQAGLVKFRNGFVNKAIFHYEEALRFARQLKSLRFIAIQLNNLANAKTGIGAFDEALRHADEAFQIFTKLGELGSLPHLLDTRSQIYYKQKRFGEALDEIEKALDYFNQGEDYAGLCEALYLKTTILFNLKRPDEALILFAKLVRIAAERVGEFASDRYVRQLSAQLYFITDGTLTGEVHRFKQQLIRTALINGDGSITKAAETLSTTHQNLSDLLARQFTGLRDELGIKHRSKRSKIPVTGKKAKAKPQPSGNLLKPLEWSGDLNVGDLSVTAEDVLLFFAPQELVSTNFGLDTDCLLAVVESKYQKNMPFVIFYKETEKYDCGFLATDSFTGLFYLDCRHEFPAEPFPPSSIFIIGKIVGYCPVAETGEGETVFRPLPDL